MQKQEFEKLTGIKVTDDTYKQIEDIYMETHLNKEEFCNLYINDKHELLHQLAMTAKAHCDASLATRNTIISFMSNEISKEDLLLKVLGRDEAISIKIKTNQPLSQNEKNYIISKMVYNR